MNARTLCALLGAASCFGCGDPIKDAQLIEELRVLGAQVSVEGDESRATPEPGETATATFLIADPSASAPESVWSLDVCVAVETNYGVPRCAGNVLASASQLEVGTEPPLVTFTVPSDEELGEAEGLAVLGMICDRGDPTASFDVGCGDDAVTQRVSLDVFVSGRIAANANPDLSTSELLFDGDAWSEASVDCEADDVLTVPADGAEHEITFVLGEEAREPQERELDEAQVETLQISHFSTDGSLERRFSDVPADSNEFTQLIDWTAPGGDAAGKVDFYFVVRDLRGGTSWLMRSLCVGR